MPKTIKYVGNVDRWSELAVTGGQALWRISQQEQRADSEAEMLLLTGLFTLVQETTQLPLSVSPAGKRVVTLPEGQVLNVSGGAGTAGVAYLLDPVLGGTNSLQSWTIGAGALAPIGGYAGEQRFLVTCSSGSVGASIGNAVLRAVTQASGGTGISFASGAVAKVVSNTPKRPFEFLPVADLTGWNSDTANCTVTLDNTVLYNGQPTIKCFIPAGTAAGTTVKLGTIATGSNRRASVPFDWDAKNVSVALLTDHMELLPGWNLYVGDAAYANFWLVSCPTSHYSGGAAQIYARSNEWWCGKTMTANVGGGTPTNTTATRAKLHFTLSGTVPAGGMTVNIGFAGSFPARPKATVILTLDDGFDSWDTYIKQRALYYDIPVTMALVGSLAGNPGYLSIPKIQAMFNDPSRLFDFTNHNWVHDNVETAGAALYVQRLIQNRAWMQSIGITGDGPSHHAWVQTVLDNTAIDLMRAAGFLTARGGSYNPEFGVDQFVHVEQDKFRYYLNTTNSNLTSDRTYAQVKTDLDIAIADKSLVMIMAHDFALTEGNTYTWSYAKMDQLFAYLASLRDAGAIEIKSQSRWYADSCGHVCDRR